MASCNIDNLYDSTLHLHGTTSHTLGDSTVNIKSTWRAFRFFLPAKYTVMYTCYQRHITVLGVWSISLLSTYWVLSAYFLAVLEISICTLINPCIRYINFNKWRLHCCMMWPTCTSLACAQCLHDIALFHLVWSEVINWLDTTKKAFISHQILFLVRRQVWTWLYQVDGPGVP